ncbi:ion transporter [Furfurilactobacillus entadae]|uniref:ion transporter n=1 Tax=Furfurilactobacillus entadae TaxID=2922307 RepID=UPI0035E715E8
MTKISLRRGYDLLIVLLAITSIGLTLFDLTGEINLAQPPFSFIDNTIWALFVIDYLSGLMTADSKRSYVRTHMLDLLAIIPVNYMFALFRFSRIFRIVRLFRIFRMAGVIGKLKNKLADFLKTNGFIYLLYASITVILLAASIYSTVEKTSFGNALWWSITTATTVGYGDVSPHTATGKAVAIVLMLVGVGFVGMLTSTLTAYFAQGSTQQEKATTEALLTELKQLQEQNQQQQKQLTVLTNSVQTLTESLNAKSTK